MIKLKKKSKLGAGRSSNVFNVFKDHEANWVFRRTLEYMSEKAAEIGECLYVAGKINEKDSQSWIDQWEELAKKLEDGAEEALKGGYNVSAKELFLRACNYYRTAEYGALPTHPKFHTLWEKSRNCFHKACSLFEAPIHIIEVPFDGKKLPGYFWRPDNSSKKRPTLFSVGGNDSSGEEVVLIDGPAAIRRGYNFFTFEYPGHRGTVHLYPDCVKRPDMEIPFKAAFDYLETLPGTDDRIALAGYSFGGYVVSRAAVYEKRIKALIPNSPLIDVFRAQQKMLASMKRIPRPLVVKLMNWKINRSPLMASMMALAMWNSGFKDHSVPAMLKAMAQVDPDEWSIKNDLNKINCPTLALVGDGEGDELILQAKEFYRGISSVQKDLYIFSLEKDGSDDHCQLDNRTRGSQIMFDWLDRVFK